MGMVTDAINTEAYKIVSLLGIEDEANKDAALNGAVWTLATAIINKRVKELKLKDRTLTAQEKKDLLKYRKLIGAA